MEDAVDGALRRGGRTSGSKRKRTKRTTPASSSRGVAYYHSRPVLPLTKRQRAKANIATASSGRTAVLPYFAGRRPTRIRRSGGRFRGGRNIAGTFASAADPLEMQRATESLQKQQLLYAAIEKAAKRGSWTPMDTAELEAADELARATKQQLAGKEKQDERTRMEQQLSAKEAVNQMAGPELEQAAMNTENDTEMGAARDKLWTNEQRRDDSLYSKTEKYITDSTNELDDRLEQIDSSMRAADEAGNETARSNLSKFYNTFGTDMRKRIGDWGERSKTLQKIYKKSMFDTQEPPGSRFEPSRRAWKKLEKKFKIDKDEMDRAYTKALGDPSAKSMPSLNFLAAHQKAKQTKYDAKYSQWLDENKEWHERHYKSLQETKNNPQMTQKQRDVLAKFDANQGNPQGSLWAKYGEHGPPKPITTQVPISKGAVAKRKFGDLKIFVGSLIKDTWTSQGSAGKIVTGAGAFAIAKAVDNMMGTNIIGEVSQFAGKTVSQAAAKIAGLVMAGAGSAAAGGARGVGDWMGQIWGNLKNTGLYWSEEKGPHWRQNDF